MARTTVKQVATRANINDVGDVLVKCDLGNILDGGNIVTAEALAVVADVHTFANAELWPIGVTVTTATGMGAPTGNYKVVTGILAAALTSGNVLWTPGSGSTPGTLTFLAADAVTVGKVCYEKKPTNINAYLPA